jgi:Ras-related GTP-binding protein A/B
LIYRCFDALKEKSPDAKIYIFINKMDLLEDSMRNDNFFKIKSYLEKEDINNLNIIFLATSIWDISLYKAWTYIISEFIPKKDKMKELLKKFVLACGVDEVVLLEKNILIKICSYNEKEFQDNDRFEKITEVIKKLKYTCKNDSKTFKEIFIKTANNIIYLDEFENYAYIIVEFRNKKTTLELIKLNIEIFKNFFKELLKNE